MVSWYRGLVMVAALGFCQGLAGQPTGASGPGARIVALEQEVARLQQQVGRLQLAVEEQIRLANSLRESLQQQQRLGQQGYATLAEVDRRLAALSDRINRSLASQRSDIVDLVASEVEKLAAQMQKALDSMGRSASRPASTSPATFNDNFPKTGVSYTVKSGDSLGKIARDQNSRTDWIRNANRLANDVIFPGQELFIPQE